MTFVIASTGTLQAGELTCAAAGAATLSRQTIRDTVASRDMAELYLAAPTERRIVCVPSDTLPLPRGEPRGGGVMNRLASAAALVTVTIVAAASRPSAQAPAAQTPPGKVAVHAKQVKRLL